MHPRRGAPPPPRGRSPWCRRSRPPAAPRARAPSRSAFGGRSRGRDPPLGLLEQRTLLVALLALAAGVFEERLARRVEHVGLVAAHLVGVRRVRDPRRDDRDVARAHRPDLTVDLEDELTVEND